MGKHNSPNIEWDDDDFDARLKKAQKKKGKKDKQTGGLDPQFYLNPWEVQKERTKNRRKNKQRDKDKYDSKYDDWN